ncbi:MAG: MerR family transcriptional regulator [Kofleriaceae bacterium]
MDEQWTLPELVSEVAARIAALPAPKNGQVRAVPDDRTIRYYGTLGLLDRPLAHRGRTALYGRRHLAQIVAIKRMQLAERSLAEIQALWSTFDDLTLSRMSGVALPVGSPPPKPRTTRAEFWKREPAAEISTPPEAAAAPHHVVTLPPALMPAPAGAPIESPADAGRAAAPEAVRRSIELRVELAPNVVLTLVVTDDTLTISPADIRAIRAAAAPLVTALADRWLTPHPQGDDP